MESYELEYTGANNIMGRCLVTIHKNLQTVNSVVLHEMKDNPGPSVTNAVEIIIPLIIEARPDLGEVKDIVWIEHYFPSDTRKDDTYDVVTLDEDGKPSWKSITEDRVSQIING